MRATAFNVISEVVRDWWVLPEIDESIYVKVQPEAVPPIELYYKRGTLRTADSGLRIARINDSGQIVITRRRLKKYGSALRAFFNTEALWYIVA